MTSTSDTDTRARVIAFRPRRRAGVGVGPVKLCPTCRSPLDGGPVVFRCDPCGKAVHAADIDTDYHPPATQPPGSQCGRAAA